MSRCKRAISGFRSSEALQELIDNVYELYYFSSVIRWNIEKDLWLRKTRGISFQEIADYILSGDYIDILENPSRTGQEVFVLEIKGYIWTVPFRVEEDKSIFLKTAYPSRKLFKRYGGYCETED